MTNARIQFDDGAAYERYMGTWSRRVGEAFLAWLAPDEGLRWLDVGCGSGAFMALLLDRCAPASVDGIDPSEAQLVHARARLASPVARVRQGDAMALPWSAGAFDAIVMPLVISFLPDPAAGVAEMVRVASPGALVAAYMWEMDTGFPYALVHDTLRELGATIPTTASPDAARPDRLHALWTAAGMDGVETRIVHARRTFDGFDDYWETILGGPSAAKPIASLSPDARDRFREMLRERLPAPDDDGRITTTAWASAVMGRVR